MIKFTQSLIATTLLLATSQVSAKVSVEAEKATQVNTEILVTSATDYLNTALSQPKLVVKSETLLTAQNTLVTPAERVVNDTVDVNIAIDAE